MAPNPPVRRSVLIMPVHLPKFVEKAYLRGADAICLDLEDSVPSSEKEKARQSVKDALKVAGKGGSDVFVRINNEPKESVNPDLQASIWPGLTGILLPKAELGEAEEVDRTITRLESERGLRPRSIELGVMLETARAVEDAFEIAASNSRITFLGIGHEDLSLDLGIVPTMEGSELFYAKSKLIIAARAAGVVALGLPGTLADFTDLEGLRRSATKGRQMGFKGAFAIHPAQIPILNEVFSPVAGEVEDAERIVELYETAASSGLGASQYKGKMVDKPVYERAKGLLSLSRSIQDREKTRRLAAETPRA